MPTEADLGRPRALLVGLAQAIGRFQPFAYGKPQFYYDAGLLTGARDFAALKSAEGLEIRRQVRIAEQRRRDIALGRIARPK